MRTSASRISTEGGLTADLMGAVNSWLLPGPGGIGTESVTGKDSQSPLAPSVLTVLTERAAVRNNEVKGAQ